MKNGKHTMLPVLAVGYLVASFAVPSGAAAVQQWVSVLYGASYQDELTYDRELMDLAAQHPDCIKFVPTVSRPDEARNAGWSGGRGRANLIAEEYLEKFNLPQDDTLVYTCGHPGMINDVKARVTPKGWKFKEERFWKE